MTHNILQVKEALMVAQEEQVVMVTTGREVSILYVIVKALMYQDVQLILIYYGLATVSCTQKAMREHTIKI